MPKRQAYNGVKRVRRASGTVDYYHLKARDADGKMPRLPGDYGSVEFVEAWLDAEKSILLARVNHVGETYADMWAAYETEAVWSDRTREDYTKVADWMIKISGNSLARDMQQMHAEALLDRAVTEKWHRFALYVLQVNRSMYNWVLERAARKEKWGTANPWATIKAPKKPRSRKRNRSWTPAEVAEVLAGAPLGLARAYVLGASGFDASTMKPLLWSHYVDGTFGNDRVKSGVEGLTIVPRPLRPMLESGNRPSIFICTNENGVPFSTVNSLTTASSRFLIGLAKQGRVGEGLTMHGLRHTLGKAIADAGGSLRAIQTALRHSSARMALHYSEEADRKRALLSVSEAIDQWFIGTPRDDLLAQKPGQEIN